jgi:AraC family transcriptional regulator, transcriptional activator of pobA
MKLNVLDATFDGYLEVSSGFETDQEIIAISAYTFVWNRGPEKYWQIDLSAKQIPRNSIVSASPGSIIKPSGPTDDCVVIRFNRGFYCVHDHDHEVSCNGLLFNGALSTPVLVLDDKEQHSFNILLDVIREEFNQRDEVQLEMLRTVLKRFIIKCTRLARNQFAGQLDSAQQLDLIRYFSSLVDQHHRTLHKVSDYAALLNKSPKTLANIFRLTNQKSPLQIIHDRVILEARKLLLYTDKSSKEIAFELGFNDPVQFNRLFKNETGVPPRDFRRAGLISPPVDSHEPVKVLQPAFVC